jgi:hypothetical protein
MESAKLTVLGETPALHFRSPKASCFWYKAVDTMVRMGGVRGIEPVSTRPRRPCSPTESLLSPITLRYQTFTKREFIAPLLVL